MLKCLGLKSKFTEVTETLGLICKMGIVTGPSPLGWEDGMQSDQDSA